MEVQKMTNEISFYQEEIGSNKEQIELVKFIKKKKRKSNILFYF